MSRYKGGDPSPMIETAASLITAVVVALILHYVPDLNWLWSIIGGLVAGFGGWLAWFIYCHGTSEHGYGHDGRGGSLTSLLDDLF